jgi:hypothetical protein
MHEDRHKLAVMLNSSFGSRQSIVRQGLTIKGRILAAFDMHGMPLHTREINESLRALYPFEEHLEATLYSVMLASPETFVSLGGGVFSLTTDEDTLITHHKEPVGTHAIEPEAVCALGAPTGAHSASVLQGCEPESRQFPLQVMQRIFERSEDLRDGSNWSMVELAWTLEDEAKLSRWAQIGTVELQALPSQRITCRGMSFTEMDSLGAL